MKILAYSKNSAPGVLVFVDKSGEEDSVLVNPGTPVSLSVRSVVRHDPHITYTVVGDESENEGTQVIVRRKREPSNTPQGSGEAN